MSDLSSQDTIIDCLSSAKFFLYDRYPQCLYFLDRMQEENFRDSMAQTENIMYIHEQQYFHWLKGSISQWNCLTPPQ